MLSAENEAKLVKLGAEIVEATDKIRGKYKAFADELRKQFGERWFELETKKNKTDAEKELTAGLRKVREGFKAQCKGRKIDATAAWQNVKQQHNPRPKKEAGITAARTLETFTMESIPTGLRRAARDDDLDTPEHVHEFWSDVEAAYIKRFPKMTRTKIYGED